MPGPIGLAGRAASISRNVQPAPEQDKIARIGAIFQGATGLLTSAVDFYDRINYRARPVPPAHDNAAPRYVVLQGTDEAGGASQFQLGGFPSLPLPALAIGGAILVVGVMLARR